MLLATFLIIFSAIALRDIRYGAYLVIFSMPLYLWRFSVLGIPTTALEMMIYILFLIWIFGRIGILGCFKTATAKTDFSRIVIARSEATKQSRRIQALPISQGLLRFARNDNFWTILSREISLFVERFASKQFYLLNFGVVLLFLGAIISTSISSDIRTSLGILKGWFFDPFLFFIIFINIIRTKKEIYLSLRSWLASGVAVSLISIFYLLNGDLTFDGRLRAFFLSPNYLAMYLSPAFLILLFFMLNKKVFSIKYLALSIFLLIIIIPLYFTHSFGAFLGFLAGALYLIIKNKAIKIKNIYWLGFAILLFFGLVFLSSSKFNQIINSNNRSSLHSRLMIWSSAGEIIKDNPLFGIGPGTFQEKYLSDADKFNEPYLEWAVPQPHNIFLAFYLQTGLLGFIGFILILFWFFIRRRHYIISPSDGSINNIQYPISNILTSLMIYALVHGLVDTTYWKNDLALMFWLIIGGGLTTFEMYAKLASYDKDSSNLKTK